jgi:hypothetical protein
VASSSSSSASSSSSSASSSASGGDGRPKPWVDDGVEDGEDTDEMDLAALQKEFAEEEDDEGGGDVSPRVTQVRLPYLRLNGERRISMVSSRRMWRDRVVT